jgi:hypothetical protein
LQPIVVDVSSGEEPPRQKDSASEVLEDVEVPIRALITLHDPDPTALEGPSTLIDASVSPQDLQEPVVAASIIGSSLERLAVASATANPPSKETRVPEPTTVSSAAVPLSDRVNPQEPTLAPHVVNVPLPERMRLQEPITSLSAVATFFSGQVRFIFQVVFTFFLHCSIHLPSFRA